MVASRTRKAALLLMSLDPGTAGELLKAAKPETVTEIAAELVHLEAAGENVRQAVAEPVREFFGLLRSKADKHAESFVREVLANAVGKQKSDELFGKAHSLVEARDPFLPIRTIDPVTLAQALEGQHPQVAAIVLMEIPPEKSAQLIGLLEESVRNDAIRRMTCGEPVLPEAKARIAALIRSRLRELRSSPEKVVWNVPGKVQDNTHLRRVALLLRGLKKELRDSLVQAVSEKSGDLADTVQNLMIQWEDMPIIPDRPLQEVLRSVDGRKLALALHKADADTVRRIRDNISERARAMIDEEASLMKSPKSEDVEEARETLLRGLRESNQAGTLEFVEG